MPEPEDRTRHARLDTPRELHRTIFRRPEMDQDAFGKFAERFARFMGTGQFLLYMTVFIIVWIALNLIGIAGYRWDAKPFILLNLLFSVQASYAAPLILLAQNRQEDRDRVVNERDRQVNSRGHADMEFLTREVASLRMAMGEVATRDFLRSELRALLAELEDRNQAQGGPDAGDPDGSRLRDEHHVQPAHESDG